MTNAAQNCKHCQKSSLSLLLLRPSPVALDPELRPSGAGQVTADAALVAPMVPAGLKQSKTVLRLLRAGYVHLYIPSRDTGQTPNKAWHTWRVTDEGDLLAQTHPLFATPSTSAVCSRTGHNVSGFKLIQIPDAHELMGQAIWLAFSANLWNTKLKQQNKANAQAMVEVKLGQTKAPAFKPDEANLSRQVLECMVLNYPVPMCLGPDSNGQEPPNPAPAFPFNSLAWNNGSRHMAETLQKAAAAHPKTLGHELAVVLPDPVGYAAELNALRLIAHQQGLQLKPEDQHKVQSHFALKGLADNVADLRSFNNVAAVVSRASFEALQKSSPQRMKDATWEPLQQNERPGPNQLGRLWTPQARQKLAEQAPTFKTLAKKEIEKGYDPQASQAWFQALEDKTRKALEPYERQWLQGRDHAAVGRYFALHFDEAERNRPGTAQDHSAGGVYLQEVAQIDGPPPVTSVALIDAYLAAYYKAPDDPQAFVVRALAANQKVLFKELSTQLAGDPNVDADSGGMRDKSVDFIKGLLDVKGEHFRVKYSWMTDALLGFAVGPMSNLGAAVVGLTALEGVDALAKRPKLAALAVNAAAWLGGLDTALKTAMTQQVVRPVLATFWVDRGLVNRAIASGGWMGARDGGRQRVTILTDTARLKKGPVDVQALLTGADGTEVARGTKAGEALTAKATGAIVLNAATGLTPRQGAALFTAQVEEARKVGASIRAAIPTGAKAVGFSLDGRLALASVIVQSIGIVNGLRAVDKAETELQGASEAERADKEKALRDAKLGYMDSLGGLTAGCLDTVRVGLEAMNLQRGAATGAVALNSIHALKFGAQLTGVFGGVLNAYVSAEKSGDAGAKGLIGVARLHYVAIYAFGGTGATSLVGAGLAASEFIVARQIGSRAVQQAAGRFLASRVAGVAVAATVPVAGWVLLGVGIVASVGAALMEPTKLEGWARQTPFGKGPAGQKFKTLDEQNKALNTALDLAAQPPALEAKSA